MKDKLDAAVAMLCADIAAQCMAGLFPKEKRMRIHRVELRQTLTRKGWQWSWRAIARNGRKLGWSGEFLQRRSACINELTAVVNPLARGIRVVEYGRDGKEVRELWPKSPQRKAPIACGVSRGSGRLRSVH